MCESEETQRHLGIGTLESQGAYQVQIRKSGVEDYASDNGDEVRDITGSQEAVKDHVGGNHIPSVENSEAKLSSMGIGTVLRRGFTML
jgi:hypothetical protein